MFKTRVLLWDLMKTNHKSLMKHEKFFKTIYFLPCYLMFIFIAFDELINRLIKKH